jgi:hemolysin III
VTREGRVGIILPFSGLFNVIRRSRQKSNKLNLHVNSHKQACKSTKTGAPLFRFKEMSQDCLFFPAETCPGQISWNYDRAEIIADGVVHGLGIILGLVGMVAIVIIAARMRPLEIAPTLIYMLGLISMLGISAAFNLWPISPTKWLLRRFDHSAIYVLIAGTYTPFLALVNGLISSGLTIGLWLTAIFGAFVKFAFPGRFDRLSIALYLLMGWSGVIAYNYLAPAIPSTSVWLLAIGGMFYSSGVIFHLWERLRFQNVIWHGFVLLAAACHYSAVLTCITQS